MDTPSSTKPADLSMPQFTEHVLEHAMDSFPQEDGGRISILQLPPSVLLRHTAEPVAIDCFANRPRSALLHTRLGPDGTVQAMELSVGAYAHWFSRGLGHWLLTDARADGTLDTTADHLDAPLLQRAGVTVGEPDQTYRGIRNAIQGALLLRSRLKNPHQASPPLQPVESVWSEQSPYRLFMMENWYTTYALDPRTLAERVDAKTRQAIEEDWLPALHDLLRDPYSCGAHLLYHVPNPQEPVKIFFHAGNGGAAAQALALPGSNALWLGVHLSTRLPLLTVSDAKQIICHEMTHIITWRTHDVAERPLAWLAPVHTNRRTFGSTSPFMAFNEGFAEFGALYGTTWHKWGFQGLARDLREFAQEGAGHFGLATFEEREQNEFFVCFLLCLLAHTRPGNFHRIMHTAKNHSDNIRSLSHFLEAYIRTYPSHRTDVETLMLHYGLNVEEPIPHFLQKRR